METDKASLRVERVHLELIVENTVSSTFEQAMAVIAMEGWEIAKRLQSEGKNDEATAVTEAFVEIRAAVRLKSEELVAMLRDGRSKKSINI